MVELFTGFQIVTILGSENTERLPSIMAKGLKGYCREWVANKILALNKMFFVSTELQYLMSTFICFKIGNKPIDVSKPYIQPNFMILKSTEKGFVVFNAQKCGVEIAFYGRGIDSVVTVGISSKYKNKMTGLCGDCDGHIPDDLLTKNGVDVKNNPKKFYKISNSFAVDESLDKGNIGG